MEVARLRRRDTKVVCPNCGEAGRPEFLCAIPDDSPLTARTLAQVGIPPYDIVRIDGEDESGFFLLDADREGAATGWWLDRRPSQRGE